MRSHLAAATAAASTRPIRAAGRISRRFARGSAKASSDLRPGEDAKSRPAKLPRRGSVAASGGRLVAPVRHPDRILRDLRQLAGSSHYAVVETGRRAVWRRRAARCTNKVAL